MQDIIGHPAIFGLSCKIRLLRLLLQVSPGTCRRKNRKYDGEFPAHAGIKKLAEL